ncbi:RhoGAP-domain-containing protein [Meira miltonrushii]|uniref:RhoGAP-domain-containing protein n=1 Tax=Meira miltonrushii TaxID=1280837 RepID=A0A316V6E1_9BASI|nr:RhoGAP-domain-containing protein [Meira miltonrushii]PWN33120.1 RhoGAP-domain-containing protein [Meira miltonrushii]
MSGSTPIGLGVSAASSASSLAAPDQIASGFSLSPGATSDLSNEAAAGHAFSNTSSSNGGPLFAPLRHSSPPQSSPATIQGSTNNASTQSPSTRIVGGFDGSLMDSNSTDNTTADTSSPSGHVSRPSNASTVNVPTAGAGPISAPSSNTSFNVNVPSPFINASSNTAATPIDEVIPTTFDESTLRALCELDCGMPLLYDRIKQSMVAANHASAFFKKRAVIEEEYGRSMLKLAKATGDAYGASEAKAGSYVSSWQSLMRTHEVLGDSRIRFAQKLIEISDELANLSKEVDKNRKYARDTGNRLERNLLDAESSVEKSRNRFDSAAEDLERLLLLKSGESAKGGELHGTSSSTGPPGKRTLGKAIGKSGLLFKNKNPQQILRQEEEIRTRTSNASDAFRKEVLSTQGVRQEYFNLQLPRILRSLKESSEEIDNGLQYHLSRYAFLYESTILSDGMSITPVSSMDGSTGLKSSVESIDNRADFKQFMQNYQVLHGREYKGPRREGPYEEGFVPANGSGSVLMAGGSGTASGSTFGSVGRPGHTAQSSMSAPARPIFGVPLADQMIRDNVDVPPILEKCADAIEQIGIENKGIYRLSGTTSKVQRLKAKFDADWSSVDLLNDEAMNDINIVAGCLKLWFRELPEPLMTWELYGGFIEAAKIENDRLRHIRMHERVNDLPDANYATLKYLMGHLDKIRAQESINQMGASNLAIVFGPTLLSPPPQSQGTGTSSDSDTMGNSVGNAHLQDMSFQCKAVETILERYEAIFVDEGE